MTSATSLKWRSSTTFYMTKNISVNGRGMLVSLLECLFSELLLVEVLFFLFF